jgi:hypothetical protein
MSWVGRTLDYIDNEWPDLVHYVSWVAALATVTIVIGLAWLLTTAL